MHQSFFFFFYFLNIKLKLLGLSVDPIFPTIPKNAQIGDWKSNSQSRQNARRRWAVTQMKK